MSGAPASLRDLRAFVAVAETGSFSEAGRTLGLSQPTVSQRLQSLEGHYGLRLLERRHGTVLTAAGRELVNRARLLLSRADELDLLARDLAALKCGRLAVGYSTPSFAMPIVANVLRDHPGLEIAHDLGNTTDLLEALHRCRIDVAVMTLDGAPEALRSTLIAPQAPLVCVPVVDPWAGRQSIAIEELEDRCVVVRERGSMTRSLFERSCAARGLRLARTMTVPSREAVKEAVVAGLGLGIVLEGEVGPDPRVRGVTLTGASSGGGAYGVSLAEVTGLPAIEAFFVACHRVANGSASPKLKQ